ncbi:MAG: DNA polymerase III subunit delta [Gemmatimonadaceae bacterium]
MPAVLSPRAFQKALADRAFAPVYLIQGEDDFLKDGAVRQLVGAVVDPGVRDFNLEMRRGGDLDAETLGALLGTPPMMADRRLVVVRDVGALRKDARKALDHYLARPAADTVVALVAAAGAKADRPLAEHASVTPVEYRQLRGDEVPKWIAHHVDSELGGSITAEAASLLHGAVGNDLAQLASELDKLLSYTAGEEIDEAAVGAIVGVRRGETLGDFLDAVGDRDARRALHILPHVLQQPKTTGVSVVMALAMQVSALAWAQAARAEGLAQSRVEQEFFTFLKEAGGFAGRAWGEATRSWARQYRNWSAADLDAALDVLLEADVALKDSRVSSDEQLLTSLVLALCVRRGV